MGWSVQYIGGTDKRNMEAASILYIWCPNRKFIVLAVRKKGQLERSS